MRMLYAVITILAGFALWMFWPQGQDFTIDKSLYPFNEHLITLSDNSTIHYVDEGTGPVILLLHGNPTWSFLYRKMIPGLAKEHRVIAPDYPGFGLSRAPEGFGFTASEQAVVMQEFLAQMDLQNVTIFVQDWGGPIGLALAEKYPDRIERLIIGNTWAWPIERDGQRKFSQIMGGPVGRFSAWCCNGMVRIFFSRGVMNPLSKNELRMYLAPFNKRASRAPTHIFPAELTAANAFLEDVRDNLPLIADKPVLLVWGQKDFAFQAPERERFEAIFKDHQTILLENAGHFIQEDAPDDILEAIKDWEKQLTTP